MKTPDNTLEIVAELIAQSVKIDLLVMKSRLATEEAKRGYDQELALLRAKQREITDSLHLLEKPVSNVWENIGNGG
ncbi:MAG: hypothetical protein NTV43_00760 [Methylococcales bacterium]|nr:hypothetical protein [Methylococcales bacterium]